MSSRRKPRNAGQLKIKQPTPLTQVQQKPLPERRKLVVPIDILEIIMEWINNVYDSENCVLNTLAQACLVNRMWCAAFRPHLYKRVSLKTRTNCDVFLSAIRRLPKLGSTVRVLSIALHPFQWGDILSLSLYDLPWILICLPMLYELRLELKPHVSLS